MYLDVDKFKNFDKDNHVVIKYKIGYSNDKLNPLSNINFYKPKDMEIFNDFSFENYSLLTNSNHQEYIFRIYCLNPNLKKKLI